jgi:hypothetical protein
MRLSGVYRVLLKFLDCCCHDETRNDLIQWGGGGYWHIDSDTREREGRGSFKQLVIACFIGHTQRLVISKTDNNALLKIILKVRGFRLKKQKILLYCHFN